LSDRFDRRLTSPGEKNLGPFARKGTCDSAADRASGSVDHRNLVLQQHCIFSSFISRTLRPLFRGPLPRTITRLVGSRRLALNAEDHGKTLEVLATRVLVLAKDGLHSVH